MNNEALGRVPLFTQTYQLFVMVALAGGNSICIVGTKNIDFYAKSCCEFECGLNKLLIE